MAAVEIYTKDYCPYCKRAKAALTRLGVTYTEYEITSDAAKTEEMIRRSGGRRTVPQIFFGDVHIGGSDDLAALERSGALQSLIDAHIAA